MPDITALDEAFRNVVRTGFVLEKGQTRHNDLMYKDIINNLFHYIARQDDLPGWIAQALTPEETTKLREHPDKPWDRMIRSRRQAGIWEDLIHSMKEGNTALHKKRRKQLQKLLYASNPLTFRSDGYPEQTYSLLDRLKLRSVYPLKFEEGIISDSQNLAPFRQRFLAEAFGMHAMKHMPLFEDLLNFGISQTLMSRFGRHGGAEAAEEKATLLTSLGVGTGYKGLHVIVPASDSGKEGGPGARLKALRQYRKLIRKAIQTHTPIQIMLGGGLSLGRFGGDVGIVRRIIAQELKAHGVKRGRDYDWHNPEDAAMLRMISAVLYTEQGRANRLLSATPGQICDTIAGRIVESAEDLLDLTGAAEIIDPPAKLTLLQERMLDTLADRSLATFNILRHVKDENGTRILDTLAEGIRPALSMPFANNGARPASKSGNKGITEERAIGNDQSLHAAQTFHGGFYGLGQVMAQLKEENADDLSHLLRNNPDVEYGNIISGLTDALRFNAQTLFAKASPDKDWNFDKALRLGHETDIVDGSLVCHDPAASKEEAYLAKIYYDRVLFFAVLEGAATGKLDQPLDKLIKTIRPKNGQLDVYPGPATLARWPDALDIAVEHDKNGPGYALIWGMEKALKNGQDIPEDHKRAIMGSWRAGTASHSAIWAANAQQGITPYAQPQTQPQSA
ncbi:MAG: hypothetical protein LRZ85_09765 [Alphaproteobacteria bacterium]|nr:hypothetical protein [Alphaproteobacteria bacterium]